MALEVQAFLEGADCLPSLAQGKMVCAEFWCQDLGGMCLRTKVVLTRDKHHPGAGFVQLELCLISQNQE